MASRFDTDFAAGAAIALDDYFGEGSVTYTTVAGVASTIRATIDAPRRDLEYASIGQAEKWVTEAHVLTTEISAWAISDTMTISGVVWTIVGGGEEAGYYDLNLERLVHITRSKPDWQR